MKALKYICLSLLFCWGFSLCIAADVRVIAKVETEGDLLVGQRHSFYIEIQTDTWFSGPIEILAPSVDGLIVGQLERFGVNGNTRIDGKSFTTHRKNLELFALRPGSYEIPSVKVRATVANPGKKPEAVSLDSPVVSVTVVTPPGVAVSGPLIATTRLELKERWEPEPCPAKVGDAFVRHIRIEADDVMAMVFPEVPLERIGGVRVYREPPEVRDTTNRGSLTGYREETLTYVFEKPGTFKLQNMSLEWWNLKSNELKREAILGPEFIVEPVVQVPEKMVSTSGSKDKESPLKLLIGLGLLSSVLGVVCYWWFKIRCHSAKKETYESLYKDLQRLVSEGTAESVYKMTLSWMGFLPDAKRHRLIASEGFCSLESHLSGYQKSWNRQLFQEEIAAVFEEENGSGIGMRHLVSLNP